MEPNMNISLSFAQVVVNCDPLGVGGRASTPGRGVFKLFVLRPCLFIPSVVDRFPSCHLQTLPIPYKWY